MSGASRSWLTNGVPASGVPASGVPPGVEAVAQAAGFGAAPRAWSSTLSGGSSTDRRGGGCVSAKYLGHQAGVFSGVCHFLHYIRNNKYGSGSPEYYKATVPVSDARGISAQFF